MGWTIRSGRKEPGKKDDDYKYMLARQSSWSNFNHIFHWRRRRTVLVGLCILVLYVTLKVPDHRGNTVNDTYERPIAPELHFQHNTGTGTDDDDHVESVGPRSEIATDDTPHTYDGPVRFNRLGDTLRGHSVDTTGWGMENKNVVFAMASWKSTSILLPLICDMAKLKKNMVHAVVMARDDLLLGDILRISGIEQDDCPAVWHDARPDYVGYSSDTRAEAGASDALIAIHQHLRPQAVIIDGSDAEELFLQRSVRTEGPNLDIPVIEIPEDKTEDLTWLARLDAGALRMWHAATVEVLIQVPSGSSGIKRLLQDLVKADYSGLSPPSITIELPADLDDSLQQYLSTFKWPLNLSGSVIATDSRITVRRRTRDVYATHEDTVVRFVEMFYPAGTNKAHALLLSPQVQLSPKYYHYAIFALLEYKYSDDAKYARQALAGLSLNVPPLLPDGKTRLEPPFFEIMSSNLPKRSTSNTISPPFLLQAPNSNAMIIFGDVWAELHSFVSKRVAKHRQSPEAEPRSKSMSQTYPAWTEYLLELMRIRGFSLLHPAIDSTNFAVARPGLYPSSAEVDTLLANQVGTVEGTQNNLESFAYTEERPRRAKHVQMSLLPADVPLHHILSIGSDASQIPNLPVLLHDGKTVKSTELIAMAKDFADKFRDEVGSCESMQGKYRETFVEDTDDLFCLGSADDDE